MLRIQSASTYILNGVVTNHGQPPDSLNGITAMPQICWSPCHSIASTSTERTSPPPHLLYLFSLSPGPGLLPRPSLLLVAELLPTQAPTVASSNVAGQPSRMSLISSSPASGRTLRSHQDEVGLVELADYPSLSSDAAMIDILETDVWWYTASECR
ncbi:hypothetical protein EW146_g6807 [Bondarzewia mesenterica]|uniref:Uncharacterized protein n=1 Tax=Bondarzewia mesenterica TaxID=1095465 RepID=A0A4S4LMH9_9AGAM|nr:hypothetical protein EW146_g6807 [Bondarzewia mesenterica]